MNRPKSTACQESNEQLGDVMNTPLDESTLLDKVPGEIAQMSSTLGRSSTAANDSNLRLPKGASVDKGTLLEHFTQLMNQRHLLVCGIDKLQERNNEARKKYEGWLLDLSNMEVKTNKARQEIETILADNRAVLASIKSTSAIDSDDHRSSLLTDSPTISSNQVLPELVSNVSSSPPETVQSPDGIFNNLEHLDAQLYIEPQMNNYDASTNVDVSHIDQEYLDDRCDDLNEQQLNNDDTSTNVDVVTSNSEMGGENSGNDFGEQEPEHRANYSSGPTVVQSSDLFSHSTSTGQTFEVGKMKTRFGGNRSVNGLRGGNAKGFDDDLQVVTGSVEQFVEQQTNLLRDDPNQPSTSSGRKRKSANQTGNKQKKTRSTGNSNHECKFVGCSKSFPKDSILAAHERIHLMIKSFSCTWDNCAYASEMHQNVVKHILMKHFRLPRTLKEQRNLNIVDDRDPGQFVQVDDELIQRRL